MSSVIQRSVKCSIDECLFVIGKWGMGNGKWEMRKKLLTNERVPEGELQDRAKHTDADKCEGRPCMARGQ